MFEVLSGHQPFRSMENSKYDSPLMSQWLERFGDLPQEWATRVPQDVTSICKSKPLIILCNFISASRKKSGPPI